MVDKVKNGLDGKGTGRKGKARGQRERAPDADADSVPAVAEDPQLPPEVMAAILGVGVDRLRQMVGEGLPRVARGLYPLAACVQWYVNFWKSRALERAGSTVKIRGDELRNTILEAKAAEATGHLVAKADVVLALDAAFLRLGKSFETLPSALARECNLPPEATRKLRARLDDYRKNFARDTGEYLSGEAPDAKSRKRA